MRCHPGYWEKFADNLKRELPRVPFAPDFAAFAKAGQELARLHLDYENVKSYELIWIETPGVPLSYRVEDKLRLIKYKTTLRVNLSLTLANIPPKPSSTASATAAPRLDHRPIPSQTRQTQRYPL
jgi:predicted helicase